MKLDRRYDILLVGGLALLVRLIYIIQLSATPFFEAPIVDAGYHDAWAREILRLGIGHEGVFFRAPLYPYFLALIYSLTGGSFFAARLVQVCLGTAAAVLTYLLGLSLTGRRAVALMAGIGAALYGMLVYFDGELLVETLFIPLLLATCLAYVRTRREKKPQQFLLTGILLGLAAVTRPTVLVLLPIFLLDLLISGENHGKGIALARKLIRSFALLTGCFLPIVPVTWHNLYQGGNFVLIASYGGVNFYIGNNPEADGMHSHLPGLGSNWDLPTASHRAFLSEGRILTPSEVSGYYYKLAREFIANKPLAGAKLTLKKLYAFWNRLEVSNNRSLYFFQSETLILPYLRLLGFWLVGPLGLLGWWVGWRRRLLPGWFLWFIPLYMLGVVAFFVTARFRAPLIPFLLICAAIAVLHLFEKRRVFIDRRRLFGFAALFLLVFFVNSNLFGFQKENPAHSHFSLGNAYLKKGNLAGARKAYQWASKADSTYPLVRLNLGVVAYREGDPAGAEREYLKELELNPRDPMALNNLGVLRFEQGRLEEARELYDRAHEAQPYFKDAIVNLAQCHFQLGIEKAGDGETIQAAEHFRQACQLDGENSLYYYNYALALGRLGYAETALVHLKEALRLAPDFKLALDLLKQIEEELSGDLELSP